MFTVNLFQRLTHKYRDGWASEDAHSFLCTAKATPLRQTREAQEFDDGGDYVTFVRVPSGASSKYAKRIVDALVEQFGTSQCRHEHDCCGCAVLRADAKRVERNRYMVHISVRYNY